MMTRQQHPFVHQQQQEQCQQQQQKNNTRVVVSLFRTSSIIMNHHRSRSSSSSNLFRYLFVLVVAVVVDIGFRNSSSSSIYPTTRFVTITTAYQLPASLSSSSSSVSRSTTTTTTTSTTTTAIDEFKLVWNDVNIFVVTDVHSWIGGHSNKGYDHLDITYGDIVSFYERIKQYCSQSEVDHKDVWFVMNGDWIDGTGLVHDGNAQYIIPILEKMPFDIVNVGNHELYNPQIIKQMIQPSGLIENLGTKYLSSNVRHSTTDNNNNGNTQQQLVPIGNNYKILKGKHSNVLVFGFLYNMKNNDPLVTVIEIQQVIKETWFIDVLLQKNDEEVYDSILIMAHMGARDPLVQELVMGIRTICSDHDENQEIPIQFITGHTHNREYVYVDPISASFEAGKYLDTFGFVSYPTKTTIQKYRIEQQQKQQQQLELEQQLILEQQIMDGTTTMNQTTTPISQGDINNDLLETNATITTTTTPISSYPSLSPTSFPSLSPTSSPSSLLEVEVPSGVEDIDDNQDNTTTTTTFDDDTNSNNTTTALSPTDDVDDTNQRREWVTTRRYLEMNHDTNSSTTTITTTNTTDDEMDDTDSINITTTTTTITAQPSSAQPSSSPIQEQETLLEIIPYVPNENDPVSHLFYHTFMNGTKSVLYQTLQSTIGYNGSSSSPDSDHDFMTENGQELSTYIHRVRLELGLLNVIGCVPENQDYYVNRSIDSKDSLWNLFQNEIVPMTFPKDVVLLMDSDSWRYDLYHGEIIVDDAYGISPFNDTFAVYENISTRILLKLNETLNVGSGGRMMNSKWPLPNMIFMTADEDFDPTNVERTYSLYVREFGAEEYQQSIQTIDPTWNVTAPIPVPDLFTTNIWINFLQQRFSLQSGKTCESKKHHSFFPNWGSSSGSTTNDQGSNSHSTNDPSSKTTGYYHNNNTSESSYIDQMELLFASIAIMSVFIFGIVLVRQRDRQFRCIKESQEQTVLSAYNDYYVNNKNYKKHSNQFVIDDADDDDNNSDDENNDIATTGNDNDSDHQQRKMMNNNNNNNNNNHVPTIDFLDIDDPNIHELL